MKMLDVPRSAIPMIRAWKNFTDEVKANRGDLFRLYIASTIGATICAIVGKFLL